MNNPAFSIPVIDLSDRIDIQTVVDREEGQYLGHVTTAMLEDGKTVYAVYPKSHAAGQVVLKRSDDGGYTWSERLPVPASWTWSLECPTLYRLTDASGKSRLYLFSGGYPGMRSVSEDDGKTFSEFESMGFGGIVFISTMVNLAPGKYAAFFHDEGYFIHGGNDAVWEVQAAGKGADRRARLLIHESNDGGKTFASTRKWWVQPKECPGDEWETVYKCYAGKPFPDKRFKLYMIVTEDGGVTWTKPREIADHEIGRLCEPLAIKSPDGSEMIVILRENARKLNSMLIKSTDSGETWSEAVELPNALTGDRHTARYLPDGRLFITFRDMAKDSTTKGSWVAWVGTYDDIVNGREGQYRILIKKNYDGWDCAYPGLELLPDGTLLTVTYGHWEEGKPPYILAVHIDVGKEERGLI